jgi:hypothetical protein
LTGAWRRSILNPKRCSVFASVVFNKERQP